MDLVHLVYNYAAERNAIIPAPQAAKEKLHFSNLQNEQRRACIRLNLHFSSAFYTFQVLVVTVAKCFGRFRCWGVVFNSAMINFERKKLNVIAD